MSFWRKCGWLGVAALLLPAAVPAELPPLPQPGTQDQDLAVAGALTATQRYLRLGKLAEEKGDHNGAAHFLEQARQAAKSPEERCEAQLAYLTALCKNGDAALAAKEYEAARKARELPEDERTILLEVRLALLRNDQAYAETGIAALKRALASQDPQKATPLACELLLLQSEVAEQHKEPEKAAAALRELLALQDVPEPVRFQAQALLQLNALSVGDIAGGRAALEELRKQFKEPSAGVRAVLEKLTLLQLAAEENFSVMLPRMEALLKKSGGCDPLLARVVAKAAEHAMKERRFTDAVSLWEQVFALAGDRNWRGIALQGIIAAETGAEHFPEAVRAIDRYVGYFPGTPEISGWQLQAAELEARQGLDAAAQKRTETVFQQSTVPAERVRAARLLAQLYQRIGSDARAVTMYRFVADHAATPAECSEARQALGEFFYRQNDYLHAAETFSALIRESAERPEVREQARIWLVQSLFQQREYEKALKVLEQGEFSGHADPLLVRRGTYLKALLWEQLGRSDEAIAAYLAFEKSYPDAPESSAAHFAAAGLATSSSVYSALELFQSYADRYPGEMGANALYKALTIAFARQEQKLTEKLLERLNREYPDSKYTIGACFWKLDALRESGATAEAIALLDQMDQRYAGKNPELKAELLYARAMLLLKKDDRAAAQAALKLVTAQYAAQPAAARAFFRLGDLAAEAGKYEEAAACYRQAGERQSNGDFAAACAGRAADASFSCYAATHEERWLVQAIAGYEELLQQYPDLADGMRTQTVWKLGHALEASGNSDRALRLYRELLYHAIQAKRENRAYAPVWCAKALQSAVDLLLARKDFNSALEAVELLTAASELHLPGENETARIRAIRAEYGLADGE